MITVNLRAKTYLSTEVIHLYRVKNLSRKAPHVMLHKILDDDCPIQRKQGLTAGLALTEIADEVWVFGERIT